MMTGREKSSADIDGKMAVRLNIERLSQTNLALVLKSSPDMV